MMNWNDHSLNPKVVLGYYDEPPKLDGVEIVRLCLSSHDGTAEIVFEPSRLPDRPSPRWPEDFNACQITIRAIGVTGLNIDGCGTPATGSLSVDVSDVATNIIFEGTQSIRVECSHFDVPSVAGYRRSDK